MAPKKKHIAEKTKIQPPEVPDDKVEQAVKLLQDKDVKEKCRQSMYYALQIGGKKQEYDASDGAAKKRYAICLLQADRLFDGGVLEIHHGQPPRFYKKVLSYS